MNAQQHNNGDSAAQLRLDSSMTIYHAAELKELLVTTLAQAPAMVVDLSAVGEIDTTGLQLLLALRRHKKPVMLVKPSYCIQQLVELLQIKDLLDGELDNGALSL